MSELKYKIYCDESSHLEHDGSNVMVIGAIRCPADQVVSFIKSIKVLRQTHRYHAELKWTKLHSQQFAFYRDLIDLFFELPQIRFKATVVQDKDRLNHEDFAHKTHSEFYYRVMYYTLRDFIAPHELTRVYLDYMDTQGAERAKKLWEVINNKLYGSAELDFYIIRSFESQIIQLCDLLIGAVAYQNRTDIEKKSIIKTKIVDYIETKLCRKLTQGTPPWEEKFNLFMFLPSKKTC